MRHYKKIMIINNIHRLMYLSKSKTILNNYFHSRTGNERHEYEIKFNQRSHITELMLGSSDINTAIHITNDEGTTTVNVIRNFDLINPRDVPPSTIVSYIDRAIGVYKYNIFPSLLRSINPFLYIAMLLNAISLIPVYAAEKIGMEQKAIEESKFLKFLQFIFWLIGLVASLITIVSYQPINSYIKDIFSTLTQGTSNA